MVKMIKIIGNEWDYILQDEYKKEYFKNLFSFLKKEYKRKTIFPEYNNIFRALTMTDYKEVKVLILGQDPYHGINQAHGLVFSVPNKEKRPPSLRNIFQELENDLGINREKNDLSDWAVQGILLLNSILTVEKDQPLSHKNMGWERFTNHIIEMLNNKKEPVVFILWGNYAKEKKSLITYQHHKIIEGAHPSPLSASRGFFGSKPFSKTNDVLIKNGIVPIKW